MRRLVLLAAVCAAAGCGKRAKPAPTPPTTPAPAAVSVGPPVTAEEADDFADDLELAVGDPPQLVKLMRLQELFDRSVTGIGLSAAQTAQAKAGAGRSVVKLAEELSAQFGTAGRYERLRVRTRDGRPSVVFRAITPDGAVNYHEYPLVRYPDGVGPSDLYVYATAEPVSAVLRRLMTRIAAELDRGLLDRLTGAERLYVDNLPRIEAMTTYRRAGRPAQVVAEFNALPAALQADKSLLVGAMSAAGQVDEPTYLRLMERFRAAHPGDPALDLMGIDYHYLRKEYPPALAALGRLDEAVGGDPYLDLIRANLLAEGGRPADARAAAERLAAWRPQEMWGYQAGMSAAVVAKDHPATLDWFKRGAAAGAMEPDLGAIRTDDAFAAFRRSPQFAELERWLAGRAAPAGGDR